MIKSIRWRLQLWYGLVLVAVVVGFAGILFYQVRAARLQEIDNQLEAAALYLEAAIRGFPPHELEGGSRPDGPPPGPRPDGPPGPRPGSPGPDDRRDGPGGRPGMGPGGPLGRGPGPPPSLDRLLAELTLPPELDPVVTADGEHLYFAVWRPDGRLLKAVGLPPDVTAPSTLSSRPTIAGSGNTRQAQMLGPRQTRILVGKPIGRELSELRSFGWQLAGAGVVVLIVGLAGGWLMSMRVVRPIAAMSATASAISATNLSDRIDPKRVDTELAGLAHVLNAMFDRLEAAFQRQTQFTADASHELRTPLTIIRTHAELALSRSRSPEEYRQTLETCLRAVSRMGKLVDGLLTLARTDGGEAGACSEVVELSAIVAESASLVRPLAEGRGLEMTAELASIEVVGDAIGLAQVVTNLLHNAIQYNRDDGEVRISLTATADEAVLSVSDTGCGIPEEDRPHIFERFYRVDKARSRAVGGNGLGLAICKSIIEAHGGRIGFETELKVGSTFWVRLPRYGEIIPEDGQGISSARR